MGQIESDPRIRVERILLHASDDANDRLPWILRGEFDDMNALADRLLPRPELIRHVFVDDDGKRLCRVFLLVEESSAPQWNFHGLKIMTANDPLIRVEKLLSGKRRAPLDSDRRPGKGLAQGK